MINNLFSIFDPSSSIFIQINWISIFLGIIIFPTWFWFTPSRISILFYKISSILHKEFRTLLGPTKISRITFIPIAIFISISFNNSLGLIPYIFTSSSHIVFTLTLALPLWISFILFGWINHSAHILAHLVPQGTPPALISFIVCIEIISNIIRPITLSVRLAANIIAGHLLITLLGNTGPFITYMTISIIIFTQFALLILESAVAFIQSYVFAILRTLYSRETY